jgi:hypothetical protein
MRCSGEANTIAFCFRFITKFSFESTLTLAKHVPTID